MNIIRALFWLIVLIVALPVAVLGFSGMASDILRTFGWFGTAVIGAAWYGIARWRHRARAVRATHDQAIFREFAGKGLL